MKTLVLVLTMLTVGIGVVNANWNTEKTYNRDGVYTNAMDNSSYSGRNDGGYQYPNTSGMTQGTSSARVPNVGDTYNGEYTNSTVTNTTTNTYIP